MQTIINNIKKLGKNKKSYITGKINNYTINEADKVYIGIYMINKETKEISFNGCVTADKDGNFIIPVPKDNQFYKLQIYTS